VRLSNKIIKIKNIILIWIIQSEDMNDTCGLGSSVLLDHLFRLIAEPLTI
jgi:hypothetical protein